MNYLQDIRASHQDPRRLEDLYQTAQRENKSDAFTTALLACYEASPDDILYAAWTYRLQKEEQTKARSANWKLAVPLSVVMGLAFWMLSDSTFKFDDNMPYLLLIWALIAGCFAIAFVTFTNGKHRNRSLLAATGLVVAGLYVTFFTLPSGHTHYRDLMVFHLPILAWIGVGLSVLGRESDVEDRFAFLAKSFEVFVTGGVYMIAGMIFVGVTYGMVETLGVSMPDTIERLLGAGGFGLIPMVAVASVYDPLARPAAQRFEQGVGKLISTLMSLLLPLTLLVLIIYLFIIPFNFSEPFDRREVLIVYNGMLFAIMGLLVGVTPVRGSKLSGKHQAALRTGIMAVAALTVIVSLYALSAIVSRTLDDRLTINRLTVIGWNSINTGILCLLIYRQFKDGPAAWIRSLQSVFSLGAVGYVVWTIFLILATPLLF